MSYNHDVFTEVWQAMTAIYPCLISQHKAVTDLVHLSIKKGAKGRLTDNRKLTIINECITELGIHQNQKAFRAFAGSYHGIMGGIIRHGKHWRAEQPGPKQTKLLLPKPPKRRREEVRA